MGLETYRRRQNLGKAVKSAEPKTKPRRKPTAPQKTLGDIPGAKKSQLPKFIQPQLATLVDSVPRGDEWLYEIKFDGYRILCRIDNGRVSLLTREAQDWTHRFKNVAGAAQRLRVKQALLDGEVVALEEDGTSNFQLLQNSLNQKASANLVYFVFDLLHFDGQDLTSSPLLARKERLEKILTPESKGKASAAVRYSEHWIGQGDDLLKKACEMGIEGIIAKKANQRYRPGRSRDWLKIKCLKGQEFVIGGFSDPAGSRAGLGALLLGVYDDKEQLHYAGRVGTGFNATTLRELRERLDKLGQNSPPFAKPPVGREAKGVHWVKPELVGEVAFTGWTRDGVLRHPSFKGLREDKSPHQIRREEAAAPAKIAPPHSDGNPGTDNGNAATTNSDEFAGIKLTHPDRILYPDQGITKRDLAHYYEQIADWIMPHIEGRPLTLVRCPEGYKKQCFYQRHTRESLDPAIRPIQIKERGSVVSYVSVESLSGLIALVQMGVLELHAWGSRKGRIEQPDRLVFDLDPDPSVSWEKLKEAAETLRSRLSDLNLGAFVKTTGGKGLHVVVPITPKRDWNFVKDFCKAFAEGVVRSAPDQYTATMSKSKRKGKIFIDYLRNARTASAVCAYSTRARSGAPVSLPVRWEELTNDIRSNFNIKNVPQRLARLRRDPWEDYETARATITRAMMKRL
jgi:bifunctional non-homologous end joining protein LigD